MKILIADNHTFFREGFRMQLESFEHIGEIREATNFKELNNSPLPKNSTLFSLTEICWKPRGADRFKKSSPRHAMRASCL